MNIWLITIGEPVPIDQNVGERLHRTGFFADFLSKNGHEVTWWTSTFDHWKKNHLFPEDTTLVKQGQYRIKLLKGTGYKRNISFGRIRDHKVIAKKFSIFAKEESQPDIIICAFPTIELCIEAINYGRTNHVPVAIDIRDLWPDIFFEYVPRIAQGVMRVLLRSMVKKTQMVFQNADAILGITEQIVEWGLQYGNRDKSPNDKSFFLGYSVTKLDENQISIAESFWDDLGVTKDDSRFTAIFIGTLGKQFDFETIIRSFKKHKAIHTTSRLVICGVGESMDNIKKLSSEDESIILAGWINADQINVLMKRATIGINPLQDRFDFLKTVNNKAIEYLSAGLPIISSPNHGVLFDLLKTHECGKSYSAGNSDELCTCFNVLSEDKNLVANFSKNAEELFYRMFSAENVYSDMLNHAMSIIEGYQNGDKPKN
jgi:glycosyltransferase involved in cell wall biosynthesis